MSEQETPRCDALLEQCHNIRDADKFPKFYRLAESLERENSDLRAKLNEARVAIENANGGLADLATADDLTKKGMRSKAIRLYRQLSAALAQIDAIISPSDTQSKNT